MKSANRDTAPASQPARATSRLDRLLLCALLAVLCARPMISEVYERIDIGFLAALPETGGPTPATTAWLDTITLTLSSLILARQRRWSVNRLILISIGLLAVAIVLSTLAAGDKPLAALAGASLLAGVLAGCALLCVIQTRWMLHLLVAGLLATGCTSALRCVEQATSEFAEFQQRWEQEFKPQLIALGYDPDDPLLVNYERRAQSGEAYGFFAHPNLAGSCLMSWVIIAAGLFAASLVRPVGRHPPTTDQPPAARASGRFLAPLAALAVGSLLAVGLWLTGSLGALVAGLVGLAALLGLRLTARWSARRAGITLALLAAGYGTTVGAVATYGAVKGTLPHPSLAFRWHYWTAAAHAVGDAPVTGLGRENFSTAYMRHKDAASTEEVRNPHNLWLTLLVELGPSGLIAGLLLCGACTWAGLRSLAPPPEGEPAENAVFLSHAIGLAIGVLVVQAAFSGTPFGHPGVKLVWTVDVAVVWTVSFAVALWLLWQQRSYPQAAVWLACALTAAILAALVHGLLSFSMMTPGGLAVFVLCAAGAASGRHTGVHPRQPLATKRRWTLVIPALCGAGVVAAHLWLVTVPASKTSLAVEKLDALLRSPPPGSRPEFALAAARRLIAVSPGDASAARVAARAVLRVSMVPGVPDKVHAAWLQQALAHAGFACQRNPSDTSNLSLLARIEQELAAALGRTIGQGASLEMLELAAEHWQGAVDLYPTNPRTRISAGLAWFELWQRTRTVEHARLANENLAQALRIDEQRPLHDVVRLRPNERDTVNDHLRRLKTTTAPAASQPSQKPPA